MNTVSMASFEEVWIVAFATQSRPGEWPDVHGLVALEVHSQKQVVLDASTLGSLDAPPYGIGKAALFVAYGAPAQFACHFKLGWGLPANVLDLQAEFKNVMNNTDQAHPATLVDALTYYCGKSAAVDSPRLELRSLSVSAAGQAAPFCARRPLSLCEMQVEAVASLLMPIMKKSTWAHALLRGRYMKAVACIERNGIPVEEELLARTLLHWKEIRLQVISEVDSDYGVYDGTTFKHKAFADYLAARSIPWPMLDSGAPNLQRDTFKYMAKRYPEIAPLKELRSSMAQLRTTAPTIGSDSRNRYDLRPFCSTTGRNQPSTSAALFGCPAWMRGFIKAPPGSGLAYIDWSQQEFGIAAVLSCDQVMTDAYSSGDPYLMFAKQAGAIPPGASKASHPQERAIFKECALAVQYGMGAKALATRTGQTVREAKQLIELHRNIYQTFWAWSEGVLDFALLHGYLKTTLGWTIRVGEKKNKRSIQNFLMQANGSEMLRLACIFGTEAGVKICATVHDAVLIEAPLDELEESVVLMQGFMEKASAAILGGFALRSDSELFASPQRYVDTRGEDMWKRVMTVIEQSAR